MEEPKNLARLSLTPGRRLGGGGSGLDYGIEIRRSSGEPSGQLRDRKTDDTWGGSVTRKFSDRNSSRRGGRHLIQGLGERI